MALETDPTAGTDATPAPRLVQLDACPVCRQRPTAFAFASVDLLHAVPGVFVYERCTACGSYFQNPRAADEDLPLYYPDDYFTHGVSDGALINSSGRLQALVRRMVLRSRGTGRQQAFDVRLRFGRLLSAVGFVRRRAMFGLVDELLPPAGLDHCLELGPGRGDDMWRLTQLGWSVTGLDLDPGAAEVASARSGSQVLVGPILDHQPRTPYGLIYGSHSIEHVPHPRDTIVHLRSLLGVGGRLVLIVPNPGSISSRVYGPLSVVWDPPRHLALPSPQALRCLLDDAGFQAINVRTSARRGAHYSAIARARRNGRTGDKAWKVPTTGLDRGLQAVESLLVRLGADVGEEIVVSATVG